MQGFGPMSLTRRALAGMLSTIGAMMLWHPEKYTSPTYTVVFEVARALSPGNIAPTTVWGVGFLTVGILAQFRIGERAQLDMGMLLFVLVIAGWTVGLFAAVWPRGVATTWGGPIWPAGWIVVLLLNVGRRTIR